MQTLAKMSIEELMAVNVTSVSKKEQTLSDTAAAVFVITAKDMERAGVTSIPDALRMAPGVNVARIDANKWAVSCRGFNGRFSAKLLVLIDGRSVYTPTFSGVYWETNDVLLADVARIEVIRGPGASLWGANAVNGVINIITRHAKETQGGYLEAGAGDVERSRTAARYGSSFGKNHHWRVYAKRTDWDSLEYTGGASANDDWEMRRTGFRMDSDLTGRDRLTLQGDLYQGDISQDLLLVTTTTPYMGIIPTDTRVRGGNLMSRWQRRLSHVSDLRLQVYYDRSERTGDTLDDDRENLDLDFQHRFAPAKGHDMVWGFRYRHTRDDYTNSMVGDIDPVHDRFNLYSTFIQDEISLFSDAVRLTLGSKFEHNDFTGFEVQPTARLLLIPEARHRIWGSVSRAVRTPSRAERDVNFSFAAFDISDYGLPGIPYVAQFKGNKDFQSEVLNAYELGYRFLPEQTLFFDLALFYNAYSHLQDFSMQSPYFTGTAVQQDFILTSTAKEEIYGLELAVAWQPLQNLKCRLSYAYTDTESKGEGLYGTPRHQVSAMGQFDLSDTVNLDVWLRYVDDCYVAGLTDGLNQYQVDDYLAMDLSLGWDIRPDLRLSLTGRNLLAGSHVEMVQENFSLPVEADAEFFLKLTWRFL